MTRRILTKIHFLFATFGIKHAIDGEGTWTLKDHSIMGEYLREECV